MKSVTFYENKLIHASKSQQRKWKNRRKKALRKITDNSFEIQPLQKELIDNFVTRLMRIAFINKKKRKTYKAFFNGDLIVVDSNTTLGSIVLNYNFPKINDQQRVIGPRAKIQLNQKEKRIPT